eukprot:465740-Amphidinium_carterae.1
MDTEQRPVDMYTSVRSQETATGIKHKGLAALAPKLEIADRCIVLGKKVSSLLPMFHYLMEWNERDFTLAFLGHWVGTLNTKYIFR